MRSKYRQSDWLKLDSFGTNIEHKHTSQYKDKLKVKMSIKNNYRSLQVIESRAGLWNADQRGAACFWDKRLAL